ncbi:MAG: GxxExxY protein [Muribaculaceae bacterium]|nr:GxxExxY protein [Muribaculaceae bacterium]
MASLTDRIIYSQESYNIIGAALDVHRIIGCGFTEPIYQEAIEEEFKLRGIPFEREKCFVVTYKGKQLDKVFRPDFVCYSKIIVELKAVTEFNDEHYAQVYNYLKATGMKLGLLINFSKTRLEYKRVPCITKWSGHNNQNINH